MSRLDAHYSEVTITVRDLTTNEITTLTARKAHQVSLETDYGQTGMYPGVEDPTIVFAFDPILGDDGVLYTMTFPPKDQPHD